MSHTTSTASTGLGHAGCADLRTSRDLTDSHEHSLPEVDDPSCRGGRSDCNSDQEVHSVEAGLENTLDFLRRYEEGKARLRAAAATRTAAFKEAIEAVAQSTASSQRPFDRLWNIEGGLKLLISELETHQGWSLVPEERALWSARIFKEVYGDIPMVKDEHEALKSSGLDAVSWVLKYSDTNDGGEHQFQRSEMSRDQFDDLLFREAAKKFGYDDETLETLNERLDMATAQREAVSQSMRDREPAPGEASRRDEPPPPAYSLLDPQTMSSPESRTAEFIDSLEIGNHSKEDLWAMELNFKMLAECDNHDRASCGEGQHYHCTLDDSSFISPAMHLPFVGIKCRGAKAGDAVSVRKRRLYNVYKDVPSVAASIAASRRNDGRIDTQPSQTDMTQFMDVCASWAEDRGKAFQARWEAVKTRIEEQRAAECRQWEDELTALRAYMGNTQL